MFIQGVRALCSGLFFLPLVLGERNGPIFLVYGRLRIIVLMKQIVVTGASKGIGRAVARYLAREGHVVWALARSAPLLIRLEAEAETLLGDIRAVPVDLTDRAQLERALEEMREAVDRVDALVNNAGMLIHRPFEDLSEEDWMQLWEVNVLAPVRLIGRLLPLLRAAPRAHVVQIGSMGGFQGSAKFPGLSAYSATKAALATLGECLAEEFKEAGVAFNTLALGAVQTEMLAQAFPGYEAPLTSEEMGAFVGWFALQGHHFFNGKVLPVSVSTP